jgi:hypothetical protein
MWGLVAWPTFSDPWMNQYLETRFARAMSGLAEHVDHLGARGTPPRFGFVREWGGGGRGGHRFFRAARRRLGGDARSR